MPAPPKHRLGEFELIAKLFAPLTAKAEGAFNLTDDAAILRHSPGEELVATVDAIVESVHFLRGDPAGLIGMKALRVNLSDLAAKGAAPLGYLIALSLPSWVDDQWLTRFALGLSQDQDRYGVNLLGGDTTSTPGPLTISITAFGKIPAGKMIRRAGAKPGDLVFVSGTIGDAGAGLSLLAGGQASLGEKDQAALVARYRLPEPRLSLGPRLLGLASAALDVSDGLLADLNHIAEVSSVRIIVETTDIPLSSAYTNLRGKTIDAILQAAGAGDDYEIAFTAPKNMRSKLAHLATEIGLVVQEIGRVEEGAGVVLLDEHGQTVPIARSGYTHF